MIQYPTAARLSAARYAVSLGGPEETPYLTYVDIAESVDTDTASALATLAVGQSYTIYGPVTVRRISDRGRATH